MNNNINQTSYPSGFIKYAFKMRITYNKAISCQLNFQNISNIVLEKTNPTDVYDPEWEMIINFGPISSIEEIDTIGNKIIENIIDTLSFHLNTKISEIKLTGHGLTPRPGEGALLNMLEPQPNFFATAETSCMHLGENAALDIQNTLSKPLVSQNQYISLFRHAINADDPIVKFLILYLILYDIYKKQSKIDQQIMALEPSTSQSTNPYNNNNKKETVYTRLRNELAHRPNNPSNTRDEIISNLVCFTKIVQTTLKSML